MEANKVKSTKSVVTSNDERPESPVFSGDSDDESWDEIECKICKKSFLSAHAYEQHIHSQRHYKELEKRRVLAKHGTPETYMKHDTSEGDDAEDAELICGVCDMNFSGYKPYIFHVKGSVHSKNLKKRALKEKMKDMPEVNNGETVEDDGFTDKPMARCKLCEKEFSGLESFQQHLVSGMHKKKLQQQKMFESLKAEYEGSDGEIDDDFYKKCETCDKAFSGLRPYNIHMKSSVHKKALKRIEVKKEIEVHCSEDSTDTELICKECKKPFLDPFAFKSHLENNSHEKYKAKSKIFELVASNPEIVAGKTIQSVPSGLEDDNEDYRVGDYLLLCKLCHMCFSGPENATAHVKSRKHLKVKQEKEKMKVLLQSQNANQSESGDTKNKKPEINGTTVSNGASPKGINIRASNNVEENDDFEVI